MLARAGICMRTSLCLCVYVLALRVLVNAHQLVRVCMCVGFSLKPCLKKNATWLKQRVLSSKSWWIEQCLGAAGSSYGSRWIEHCLVAAGLSIAQEPLD